MGRRDDDWKRLPDRPIYSQAWFRYFDEVLERVKLFIAHAKRSKANPWRCHPVARVVGKAGFRVAKSLVFAITTLRFGRHSRRRPGWARSSAGEHLVDIEGVTGSMPVVSTSPLKYASIYVVRYSVSNIS